MWGEFIKWFLIGVAVWLTGSILMIVAMARATSKQPPLPFSPLSQPKQEQEEAAS